MSGSVIRLNIVMTYPVKWGTGHIMSDYIQNFYDGMKNLTVSFTMNMMKPNRPCGWRVRKVFAWNGFNI